MHLVATVSIAYTAPIICHCCHDPIRGSNEKIKLAWTRTGQCSGKIKIFLKLILKVSDDDVLIYSSMALQPLVGPSPLLQFRNLFYTDGRTPWTGDQPVERPLPKHTGQDKHRINAHRNTHTCLELD
jgi:Txe/YoeB family toxin of Txe-Axe toxin-antitoxin module